MLLAETRSLVRRWTHTNSTNYPDVTLDADINRVYGEIWMKILEAEGYKNTGGDFKVIDLENSTGLVAQELGYLGEYPFPSVAVNIEEAYIDYGDGAVKAEIINKSEISSSMFEDEDLPEFSEGAPKIFVLRDSIFIRPINFGAKVTNGIKLLIRRRQKTIVETLSSTPSVAANQTLTPEFEEDFHVLIPLSVTQDYYLEWPEKYNPRIDKKAAETEDSLKAFYESRTPTEQRFQAASGDRGLKNW